MKKFFFLALMAFLWLPATTWATEDEHTGGDHASGQVPDSDDEVYDGEQEEELGKIVPSDIQLEYQILSQPTGTYGEEGYTPGTVELEGIYSVPSGVTSYSISIPHEIQVVNVNMSTLTADVALYTVVGITMGAFGGYSASNADTSLTSVTIPYTVTYLGEDAASGMEGGSFTRCTNLTSVTFAESSSNPSQLVTIGTNAFYYCENLTSIDIPSTVTTIASNAFANCTSLTEVKIPEGVTSMGSNEFQNCTKLETVWMPGSLTLTARVFDSCTSLKNIVLEGGPGTNGGTEGTNPFNNDGGEAITLYVETGLAAEYLESAWETDLETESNVSLSWNFLTYKEGINSLSCDEEGTYYATYYTDAVGEFGSDVTPYIVTEAHESGAITKEELTGYIPAGTGVLLTAKASGDTYYYHPYGVDENSDGIATTTGNMLYGSTTGGTTTVGDDGDDDDYYFYKLTLNSDDEEGSVGFYWGAEDGAPYEAGAYKAYLAVPKTSATGLSYFSFKNDEGDTTGISAVESASDAKTVKGIYTLQGVRVSDMSQKGVYIVDGKKVLVK